MSKVETASSCDVQYGISKNAVLHRLGNLVCPFSSEERVFVLCCDSAIVSLVGSRLDVIYAVNCGSGLVCFFLTVVIMVVVFEERFREWCLLKK